ncbi:jg6360 [Pararge aegeria aegeria]|uniref:Jg6360 protein n=1 Tax=Pararge aegeria aegeria TaxID=348720 RepID=A0A8S4RSW8_9NEOP|nr:jg6360 [Pararge aegeria aegeria]
MAQNLPKRFTWKGSRPSAAGEVAQERIEGTRSSGRSPMRWANQIKAAVAFPLHECVRKAAAREEWRRIVQCATTLR